MLRAICGILICLLLAGCAAFSRGPERVDAVHLFGLPVTFNMDSKPGPDGFAVRVFVTKNGGAKGATINNGSLHILMFDGAIKIDDHTTKEPKQTWKFTAKELGPMREQTSLGHAYRFTLRWTEPPTHGYVTVMARYVPQNGEPVNSAPSTITAAVK